MENKNRREKMLALLLGLVVLSPVSGNGITKEDRSLLDKILNGGVTNKVYPGAVGVVGSLDGLLYEEAVGGYSYDAHDKKTKIDTLFDLASLTKVVSTTSTVALLYQHGYLGLDTNVGSILGNEFMNGGKENITVLNCLLHNAGFSPDPVPWYWDPSFGCPNTAQDSPEEDFSCLDPLIYPSFLTETLVTPPGEAYVYSDLSFITLQMVVGTLVLENKLVTPDSMNKCMQLKGPTPRPQESSTPSPQERVCAFEAFVRTEVFHRPADTSALDSTAVSATATGGASGDKKEQAWMPSTGYLPAQELWSHCAPTLNDTGAGSYTHKRLQGQVADGDCYAMGGIAGHAGIFSNALDVATLAQYYLSQTPAQQAQGQMQDHTTSSADALSTTAGKYAKHRTLPYPKLHSHAPSSSSPSPASTLSFLNATTVKLFTTVYNTSQSSRALGWSTNTPLVRLKLYTTTVLHFMHWR